MLQNYLFLFSDSALKNEENSVVFNNLVKYPCNNFRKPRAEVTINRQTAFGAATLVLTDFSSKSGTLERKKSQNRILDGECHNPPPANVCCGATPPRPEGRACGLAQASPRANPPTVCSPSQLCSPAYKKLRTTHYSSPGLENCNPGLSNRYDDSNLGL